MKKFTSLFALLLGLSVFSANADVILWVYSPYPSYHYLHWWDSSSSSTWKDPNNSFVNLAVDSKEINGDTFYKIVLSSNNADGSVSVIFYNPDENQQTVGGEGTKLTAGEHTYYYFGGTEAYTTCPIFVKLQGKFFSDNWDEVSFERNSMTNWTYTLTPSFNHDFDFGLYSNPGLMTKDLRLDIPDGWVSTYDNNPNLVLNHQSTYFQTYKLTATWDPSYNFQDVSRWSLKIEGVGQNLEIIDGNDFYNPGVDNFVVPSATYNRLFTYNWGTLCLPFEIKNAYEGVTFYKLSRVDLINKILSFTPTSTVAAGEPVVYKVADGVDLHISETNAYVSQWPKEVETVEGWTMHGTYQSVGVNPMNDGEYLYFFSNNNFWQGSVVNIPAFRGYFLTTDNLDNAAQAPFRIQTDDTEDIQFVEQEDGTVKAYYDIQGRKLNSARKGLVIENGKIIMVK